MKKKLVSLYQCPYTENKLSLDSVTEEDDDNIITANLVDSECADKVYQIHKGIPVFIDQDNLCEIEVKTQKEYDIVAEQFYDNAVDWLFKSYYEDEDLIRENMVDLLELKPDACVLEVGCGTGRDSFRIARRLGTKGIFYYQDLSYNMTSKTRETLLKQSYKCEMNEFVSSATSLPFPDNYFDAVFHFGGFNNFKEPVGTLKEFTRITKEEGKIVFGDESLPPWLKNTEFGNIICTNNSLFEHKLPLEYLPHEAREVKLQWIIGNCFYLIDFKVGSGLPKINLDLPHKGTRGGTMRTRYFGQLEGVTPETKKKAYEAAAKSGKSIFEWLDDCLRKKAEEELES